MKKIAVICGVLLCFSTIFSSCDSDELPPAPVPNTQEILVHFEDKEDSQRECLVGITPDTDETLTAFRVYTLNIPSKGGTFLVNALWKDYPDVIKPVDKLTLKSVYSPLNQERIDVEKGFDSADLEKSGIEEIRAVSDKEFEIKFAPNVSKHEWTFESYIDTSSGVFDFVRRKVVYIIWPEGSVVDKYYDGEMTREEAVEAMKKENLSYF